MPLMPSIGKVALADAVKVPIMQLDAGSAAVTWETSTALDVVLWQPLPVSAASTTTGIKQRLDLVITYSLLFYVSANIVKPSEKKRKASGGPWPPTSKGAMSGARPRCLAGDFVLSLFFWYYFSTWQARRFAFGSFLFLCFVIIDIF
jgi:hypothetical protein